MKNSIVWRENADVKTTSEEYLGDIHTNLVAKKSPNVKYPQVNMKYELDPIPWAIGNCNAQEKTLFIRKKK